MYVLYNVYVYLRKYENNTFVRKYFRTFVKVLSYESTFTKVVYFRTKVPSKVLSYFRKYVPSYIRTLRSYLDR